jgi:hypothetical protein
MHKSISLIRIFRVATKSTINLKAIDREFIYIQGSHSAPKSSRTLSGILTGTASIHGPGSKKVRIKKTGKFFR